VSETITTTSDTPSKSPGAVLKRCREFQHISLEEASETTKIGISYLKSLENDNVGGFANLTYLKGFLRIYATYLGLNADEMARMYEKLYGGKDGKMHVNSNPADRVRPVWRLVSLQKLALPAVLLLLILITATLFKRQPATTIHLSQPAATPSIAPTAPAVQSVISTATIRSASPEDAPSRYETRGGATSGSEKPIPPKTPADQGKGFILKIKVTQNGNLNAAVDGSGAQSYELTVGDVIEWKAEKSVALDLSNAGGVDVELNGKPLKQLGPTGKPVYVVLDADGIKP
jgi:cytoskeletal protein RodZ